MNSMMRGGVEFLPGFLGFAAATGGVVEVFSGGIVSEFSAGIDSKAAAEAGVSESFSAGIVSESWGAARFETEGVRGASLIFKK